MTIPDTSDVGNNTVDGTYHRRGMDMAAVLGYFLKVERTPEALQSILDLPIALDRAFEHAHDGGETSDLVRYFDEIDDENLPIAKWTDSASVESATMLLIRVERAGARLPPVLRERWSNLWKHHLHLHNVQQHEQCKWRFRGSRPCTSQTAATFDEIVDQYLARYSHTNALILATLASFPYSKLPEVEWLELQYDLARSTEPMLRLAQDLVFQSDEWMNLAIHVQSAINGTSPWSTREELTADRHQRRNIECRLKRSFLARIPQYIAKNGRVVLEGRKHGHFRLSLQLLAAHILLVTTLSAYVYTRST